MAFWLLIFVLTPIVEMYLLIRVGGYIGAWPTVLLVILTAVAGVGLLRVQGLATLTRGMRRLEGGELPAREMVEGFLLAAAGVLLVTPGFVTDTLGFLLLLPPARAALAQRLLDRVVVAPFRPPPGSGSAGGSFIEGEFESRTEPPRDQDPEQGDDHRRLR